MVVVDGLRGVFLRKHIEDLDGAVQRAIFQERPAQGICDSGVFGRFQAGFLRQGDRLFGAALRIRKQEGEIVEAAEVVRRKIQQFPVNGDGLLFPAGADQRGARGAQRPRVGWSRLLGFLQNG